MRNLNIFIILPVSHFSFKRLEEFENNVTSKTYSWSKAGSSSSPTTTSAIRSGRFPTTPTSVFISPTVLSLLVSVFVFRQFNYCGLLSALFGFNLSESEMLKSFEFIFYFLLWLGGSFLVSDHGFVWSCLRFISMSSVWFF